MTNNNIPHIDLSLQKQILDAAREQLKKEFIGLDQIIDRIIGLISAWYMCPFLQERPTIINLWGMTGIGKTSLVKRLVELLAFNERFFHFDMGNNSDKVDTLRFFFKDLFEFENGFPFIMALDEFQYANTKDAFGNELDKVYSRAVWDLLDTGHFQVFRNHRGLGEIAEALSEMYFFISKGVKVENGVVTENLDYFLKITNSSDQFDAESICLSEEITDNTARHRKKTPTAQSFVRSGVVRTLYEVLEQKYGSIAELKDHLLQLDENETVALMEEALTIGKSRKELDCSKALVFVIGNLDEVFQNSDSVNPDMNADLFYRNSKRITLPEIKKALQYRFRNEQIARLGNNHIVYPAMNKKMYDRLIDCELEKISADALQRIGIHFRFDKSISKIIYREGVFPSQGTRPLFSTIHQLLKSKMASIQVAVLEYAPDTETIVFYAQKNNLRLDFFNKENILIHQKSFAGNFQLQKLSLSKKDELQAVTAVHESGHALVQILLTGKLPECIYSVSSDSNIAGMVVTEAESREVLSNKKIMQRLAILLAGISAEEIVFGTQNLTVGSSTDLKHATMLASRILKKEGLDGNPYYSAIEHINNEHVLYDRNNDFDAMIKKKLDEGKLLARETIEANLQLFKLLSSYLAVHPRLTKTSLKQLLKNFPAIDYKNIEQASSHYYREQLADFHKQETRLKKAS